MRLWRRIRDNGRDIQKAAPAFFIEVKKCLRQARELIEERSCLVDSGVTAEAVAARCLGSRSFDCVMIGAGLRASPQLLLFERLINLVHEHAPNAKICFNTTPANTAEAVQRWL
jgi:ketopantoate hydroxymethyltransferase